MFKARINCSLLILLSFVLFSNCAKYPSDLPKCKPDDGDCLVEAAQTVFSKVVKNNGLQSLGIPLIEPLSVNQIDIKQGSNSPVNIRLILKNININGLSKAEFIKFTGFGKEPSGKFEIKLKAPTMNLFSDYTIDGKVLILPIVGDGKCNLTIDDPVAYVKFNGKPIIKNGKEHLEINNFRFTFTTTRLHIHFSNLYKGDKVLGDSTNVFLNENWEDIFNELKANIFDGFGQVFEQIFISVFNRIAYKDLFIQE